MLGESSGRLLEDMNERLQKTEEVYLEAEEDWKNDDKLLLKFTKDAVANQVHIQLNLDIPKG